VVAAVLLPIAPGFKNVLPKTEDAFKFATFVVEDTVKGAVPVETVLVITPEALRVVNTPELGVVLPIELGLANVLPFKRLALRLATFVVLEMVKGAVPVLCNDVKTPDKDKVFMLNCELVEFNILDIFST
jgi:hypothetical protein